MGTSGSSQEDLLATKLAINVKPRPVCVAESGLRGRGWSVTQWAGLLAAAGPKETEDAACLQCSALLSTNCNANPATCVHTHLPFYQTLYTQSRFLVQY
jgi:hypothetical protein